MLNEIYFLFYILFVKVSSSLFGNIILGNDTSLTKYKNNKSLYNLIKKILNLCVRFKRIELTNLAKL